MQTGDKQQAVEVGAFFALIPRWRSFINIFKLILNGKIHPTAEAVGFLLREIVRHSQFHSIPDRAGFYGTCHLSRYRTEVMQEAFPYYILIILVVNILIIIVRMNIALIDIYLFYH